MVWMHENSNWPNYNWNDEKISPILENIDRSMFNWNVYNESMLDLKAIQNFTHDGEVNFLTQSVVKSLNIEEIYPDEDEVRRSIKSRLRKDNPNIYAESKQWDGMIDMILDANRRYDKPPTKQRLLDWHFGLFPDGYSGIQRISTGNWRDPLDGPMQIVSGTHPFEKIYYEAPPALRVDSEMESLIEWIETENVNPILKAGVSHLRFEQIHPFEDGNGRVGRALCDLMLARANSKYEPFHTLPSQIKLERKIYYDHMEKCGRASTLDITEWLVWFLECFDRSIQVSIDLLKDVNEKIKLLTLFQRFDLNDRQKRVIRRMLESDWKGHINTSRYAKIVKCNNDSTAFRDIARLKEAGLFIQNEGGGRNTSYRLITLEEIKSMNEETENVERDSVVSNSLSITKT